MEDMPKTPEWFALLKAEYQEHLAEAAKLKNIMDIYEGKETPPIIEERIPPDSTSAILGGDAGKPEKSLRQIVIQIAKSDLNSKGLTSDGLAKKIMELNLHGGKTRIKLVKTLSGLLGEKNSKDFVDTGELIVKSKVYRLSDKHMKQSPK